MVDRTTSPWRPSKGTITFTNADTGERETREVCGETLIGGRVEDHPALQKYYRGSLNQPEEVHRLQPWPPASLDGIGKRMQLALRTKYLFEWKNGLAPAPAPPRQV